MTQSLDAEAGDRALEDWPAPSVPATDKAKLATANAEKDGREALKTLDGLVARWPAWTDARWARAQLLERMGQTNEAIVAYQRNLAEGIPADRQRQALLKIRDLSPAPDNIPPAAQILERFLARCPEAASADLARAQAVSPERGWVFRTDSGTAEERIWYVETYDYDAHEARVCIQTGYVLADPGRAYLPAGLREIGRYTVPTSRDLEDREQERDEGFREGGPHRGCHGPGDRDAGAAVRQAVLGKLADPAFAG